MSWDTLIRRRFEVVTASILLGAAFVLVVWAVMVILKVANPYVFHFNLLMDILPWFTPVLIIWVLGIPLYLRVTGWLVGPDGGLQKLAEKRYELVAGAAFYLMAYTLAVWASMLILRTWDVYDFHYNLAVDWLPAIVPPWMMWALGAPMVWKVLGALGGTYEVSRVRVRNWTAITLGFLLGGFFLTGGGLLLNEGVYAGAAGLPVMVQQDLVDFGILVFSVGAIFWAIMLGNLWWGWRREPAPLGELRPMDRLRLERPRIIAQAFVMINVAFGLVGLLMTALQHVDDQDFHFYLAKDIWAFGLPLFFGWLIYAGVVQLVPNWLARRNPARWGSGLDPAHGPAGPAGGQGGWGYHGRDLVESGS